MKKPLKYTLIGAVAFVALVSCVAANSDDDPADLGSSTAAPTHVQEEPLVEPATVAPAPEPVSEAERVDRTIRSVMLPEGFVMQEGGYYEYAELVCGGLAEGLDPGVVAMIGAENFGRYDVEMHATMVGASVGSLCPEYSETILNR